VVAIGGCHAEPALAARLNAVLLHQQTYPFLAHTHAAPAQLAPHARPTVDAAQLRVNGAYVHQQGSLTQVAASVRQTAPLLVLMIAGEADSKHAAQDANGPEMLMLVDVGELHFWPFAKNAIAFPRMSRSILTRARSAR